MAANAPGGAAAASGPSGPLELRGVMTMPGGASYCIFDVAKKRAFWVSVNEAGHDFMVKAGDPEGESVSVSYQGRLMKLTLRTAKVASSGSASAVAMAPVAGTSPAISSTVVLNPSPADEQKRLDAVAQEVRRRRLEREKAIQESQPGQGPGGAPPQAPNR